MYLCAGLAGWVTDRFYEAGMEDVMPFIGHQPLSTPEAGQWTAVAMLAGFAIGSSPHMPPIRSLT